MKNMIKKSFICAFAALATLVALAFDTPYLTFRSASSFSLRTGNTLKNWDGTIEYSTDAENWTVWSGTTTLTASQSGGEYFLYLRGTNNTKITGSSSSNYKWVFPTGNNIYCEGDIETLRGYDGNLPGMASQCYRNMFYGCSALASAPILSATALTERCYDSMFKDCTGLTAPPELPATTLALYCYYGMFSGCTSLKSLPELPATTLVNYCYWDMFNGCSSLEVNSSGPGVPWSLPSGINTSGLSLWNYDMLKGTGGDFTGNPTVGTTYKVPSALPPGQMYQASGSGTLTPVFTGSAYSWDLAPTIKNGIGALTFTLASGTLPPGVVPSGSTLTGTPTTSGTYNFTLSVEDSEHNTFNEATYSLLIMTPLVSESTTFVGANGSSTSHDCLVLNDSVQTLDQEWYVAKGTLNFGTGGIKVSGNVNLVLADGARMTVSQGTYNKAGINVALGNSLTIYGQSGGTGELTASANTSGFTYGTTGGAGIGGNENESCGTIIINGGIVRATGVDGGAGIGGGGRSSGNSARPAGGTVTINGGTVYATGGTMYGAGIGGGYYGDGGDVTINGGTVTASGGQYSANGIGKGGNGSSAGTLRVAANVCVKAGSTSNPSSMTQLGMGGTITIGTQRYFYVEAVGMAQTENALSAYTGQTKTWELSEMMAGASPFTFSGSVPSGLTLESDGTLSGSVNAAGTYPITLTVTDSTSTSDSFTWTLTVTAPDPIVATKSTLAATVGKAKNFNLASTITGGVPQ